MKERNIATIKMPNAFNVAFDYQYFLIGTMLSYIPSKSEIIAILVGNNENNCKVRQIVVLFDTLFYKSRLLF